MMKNQLDDLIPDATHVQSVANIGRRDFVSFLSVAFFLILFCILAYEDKERVFESYLLLFIVNSVFLSALPLVVSYFSLRAYMASGQVSLLMLGNGALSLGLGSVLAAFTPYLGGGPNTIATIHNTAAFLSGLFHLAGAAQALGRSKNHTISERRGIYVSSLGTFIVLLMGLLLFGSLSGNTPIFFVHGVGPTHLRQVVLGIGIASFVLSAAFLAALFLISRSQFLAWYWTGLALIAIGLMCVFVQKSVGSDIGWLGRTSQYLGCTYLLMAILKAREELSKRDLSFVDNLGAFLFTRFELRIAQRVLELAEANQKLTFEIAAHRKTEQDLKEKEEVLRSLFDTSLDGILLSSPDGTITRANKAACEILGRSEQEICELGRSSVVDVDDSRLASALQERSEKGYFRQELTFIRKDGTSFPAEVTSAAYTDSKGIMRASIFFRDATDRKLAEGKLRESEETIRSFFSAITDPIFLINRDGIILGSNDVFAKKLGTNSDSLIGTSVYSYLPPDVAQRSQDWVAEVVRTGKPLETEDERMGYHLEHSMYPLFDLHGRVDRLAVYVKDITPRKKALEALQQAREGLESRVLERTSELSKEIEERKRVEQTLAQSERKFRLITETIQDVFWMSTPGVREMVYISPAYEKIWGRSVESLYSSPQSFLEAVHPDDLESLKATLLDYHNKGIEYSCEYRIMGTDHAVHWIEERGFPVHDHEGKAVLMCGVCTDITFRKDMEQLLRTRGDELAAANRDLIRSNQDLQQFAYVASHDLQEPLRTVASALQMLEMDQKGKLGEESDRFIHYAVDGAKKMRSLVADLLTYSRITSCTKNDFTEVDIQYVLDDSIGNLKTLIDEKKAEITYDKMPSVNGDSTQLLQVFQNLIGNAVKFGSAESPKVHVSAQQNGGEWIFSVKDNGIGIEEKFFNKIFVIFQQLEKKDSTHGTGIGLSIVKRIIERHRGRVWVESELGVGSTFYFAIPIATE
jgi:PAS domain S-box-containing protein